MLVLQAVNFFIRLMHHQRIEKNKRKCEQRICEFSISKVIHKIKF